MVVLGGLQPQCGAWQMIFGDREAVANVNGDNGWLKHDGVIRSRADAK